MMKSPHIGYICSPEREGEGFFVRLIHFFLLLKNDTYTFLDLKVYKSKVTSVEVAYGCVCSPRRPRPRCRGRCLRPGWSSPSIPSDPPPAAASHAASGSLHELWPSLAPWKTLYDGKWVRESVNARELALPKWAHTQTRIHSKNHHAEWRRPKCSRGWMLHIQDADSSMFVWTPATGGRCTPLNYNTTIFRVDIELS